MLGKTEGISNRELKEKLGKFGPTAASLAWNGISNRELKASFASAPLSAAARCISNRELKDEEAVRKISLLDPVYRISNRELKAIRRAERAKTQGIKGISNRELKVRLSFCS